MNIVVKSIRNVKIFNNIENNEFVVFVYICK